MNNPVWIMSSAFPDKSLEEIIDIAVELGVQGIELCVFHRDASRDDFVATHLDYENFNLAEADRILDLFNEAGLKFSLGTYDNILSENTDISKKSGNHLLHLIRIAHLLGGDRNDIKVGTFVGYDWEIGRTDGGFMKNISKYASVFTPIVRYAEKLGVTILYENCPMEGWRKESEPATYNNLPATLAARKLMYAAIPSHAHGETYDPSHDVWQHADPVKVIENSEMTRIHRIHVKSTRNLDTLARTMWGGVYPMQKVDRELAERAGVPFAQHEWDRHHYEPTLPGFGGSDSLDWRSFITVLLGYGYKGPFCIENEAALSMGTGDYGAKIQGFRAATLSLAPLIWKLDPGRGYRYDRSDYEPLDHVCRNDVPLMTLNDV